jgi:iron complex outermembrane receptor protein
MKNSYKQKLLKKKLPVWIQLATSLSLLAGAASVSLPVLAQDSEGNIDEIVVSGQRSSVLSAQQVKRNAETIVDSIVADDIGKLPDRSVTEALQRVPGVTIERFMSIGDPEHFSAEGSGVAVRGMKHVRSELNGRDSFSASGGRSLSFEDVPAELMAGVDVYKNPSADMIEGGLGGTVNLRTKMPLDTDANTASFSVSANYGDFIEETRPSYSGLYSTKWDTNAGEFGVLIDLAYSEIATRTDGIFNRASFARTNLVEGQTVWVPRGADWRTMEFERERTGGYLAFQWRPDSDSEFYFTAFRSAYDMQWNEDAVFVNNNQWSITPGNAEYNSEGVFQRGRLTDEENGGIPFGADVRAATRESVTTDFSLGYKKLAGNWELSTDLQYTRSESDALDLTLTTGVNLPYLDLDVSGNIPKLSTDAGYLADASNYYWAFSMPHIEDAEASQIAWRADAQYNFESETIKSIKFGVRFTDREAENADVGYDWRPIYQPWMLGWALDGSLGIPTIEDPSQLRLNEFNNFYRGDSPIPAGVWAPKVDLALGYPESVIRLHGEAYDRAIALGHTDYGNAVSHPYVPRDPYSAAWFNTQDETTYAAYALMRFAFEDLPLPIDGNMGVRVVRTEMAAAGSRAYPTSGLAATYFNPLYDPNTDSAQEFDPIAFSKEYTNVLPSLNLRMTLSDNLFWRIALSQAVARPDFTQLKAFQQLSANLRGDFDQNAGIDPVPSDYVLTSSVYSNPDLKPLEADQFDTSLEWYFNDHGGMVHLNLFWKDIEGIIRNQLVVENYNGYDYAVTRPINAGTATIKGFEVGYSQFFDMLPEPFDGLGVQINYTYIDSSTRVPYTEQVGDDGNVSVLGPVDTDGTLMSNSLPYEGLSKNAYNLVGMYEKGPLSIRLAYSWRSEYLMAIGPNGFDGGDGGIDGSQNINYRLPIWSDDTGQLDGSIFYRINDNFSVGLEMNNITNAETRTIMRQSIVGERYASHFVNDTRYALTFRANF